MMPISAKEIQRSFLKFIVSLRTGRKLKERLSNSERLSAVIEIRGQLYKTLNYDLTSHRVVNT